MIALTARAMKGDRERTLAAGCDDYISKPFEAEDLLAKINEYLSKVALGHLNQAVDHAVSGVDELGWLCSDESFASSRQSGVLRDDMDLSTKKNCWEFMKCERQPGGKKPRSWECALLQPTLPIMALTAQKIVPQTNGVLSV